MASAPPDPHPDSIPRGPATDVEQVSPPVEPGRTSVEEPDTGPIE